VVLGASFAIIGMGIGTIFSLGVFLKPIEAATGWSRGAISSVSFLNWVSYALGSFVWGILSDRFGTRMVVLSGGGLVGLGLVLSSQVASFWQFALTFGLMVGIGASAFYVPLSATAVKWFTTRRGLAVAIASAGNGIGILVLSPLMRWLISAFDWRGALLILGDLAWFVVIPAGLLIRNHPGEMGTAAYGERSAERGPEIGSREVLRSLPFWILAVTHLACCATHSGAMFHMVAHAMDQGVARMAAATVLSAAGLSSIFGRIGTGMLADRYGPKLTLVGMLGLQAVAVLLFLFASDLGTFYALALIFGAAFGGVMPLYAVVTRQYFGERVMGTAYGGVFAISAFGMGLGSWAGGYIFDLLGTYQWLYLGSFAAGLLSVVLAAALRPPRLVPAPSVAPALH
jgi:MFS family permease